MTLYGQMAGEVINVGACDKYARVEECPAYAIVETHFATAEKAMCAGGAK